MIGHPQKLNGSGFTLSHGACLQLRNSFPDTHQILRYECTKFNEFHSFHAFLGRHQPFHLPESNFNVRCTSTATLQRIEGRSKWALEFVRHSGNAAVVSVYAFLMLEHYHQGPILLRAVVIRPGEFPVAHFFRTNAGRNGCKTEYSHY